MKNMKHLQEVPKRNQLKATKSFPGSKKTVGKSYAVGQINKKR